MKNPVPASVVAVCLTLALTLVTALTFGLVSLMKAELNTSDEPHRLHDVLVTPDVVDSLATTSALAFACAGAAFVASIVIGVMALRRTAPIAWPWAATPAALVALSAVIPLLTALPFDTMTLVFTLLALLGTTVQARAVSP